MTIITEITLIAVVVSIACALPGVFLVLRGTTMVSDAITHTVLLGIVLAFFVTQDLNSPFLIVGATLMGVFTVWAIETLQHTKLLGDDAAIGVVFPLFFSIAIILITRYTGDIHLDQDTVLMGELAFAPFRRLTVFGIDIGARAFVTMMIILLVNVGFVTLFYKELKVTTFDAAFAAAVGFSPVLIYYGLMTLVSLTAVGAYDSVGSILVVGFMVGPGLTAYLLTHQLKKMIGLTVLFAAVNSIIGVRLAFAFDSSIAGMIAVVTGIVCLLAFTFSPRKGLIQNSLNRRKRQKEFNEKIKKVY
ncbi:manganese/zinc/iron transport system permease protein [Marinilactibacillus piezotolerans]|uniref:Manganese/zinc/iron transport system permease protein n=1 Tax=Marinilactibacillus piezotolerans TaxID=258723 RepID=A0A1I3YUL7_9LACT|nr:metal ABC transporter permease [Marinilactibacillus piezotolerans]SFK35528.1 manganese/zinc/iron transport system permease protein [Marinilactibacillus piezotolerans]